MLEGWQCWHCKKKIRKGFINILIFFKCYKLFFVDIFGQTDFMFYILIIPEGIVFELFNYGPSPGWPLSELRLEAFNQRRLNVVNSFSCWQTKAVCCITFVVTWIRPKKTKKKDVFPLFLQSWILRIGNGKRTFFLSFGLIEKPSDVETYWDLLTIKTMFIEWLALNMNLLVVLNQSRRG
jgi:hypothetical protein